MYNKKPCDSRIQILLVTCHSVFPGENFIGETESRSSVTELWSILDGGRGKGINLLNCIRKSGTCEDTQRESERNREKFGSRGK
jgi:hypothetical protein